MVKPTVNSMGTKTSRSKLARLIARAGVNRAVFMTDHIRVPDPGAVIKQLPAGSLVILRDYEHGNRAMLARMLKETCETTGCWFLVAGDARLARSVRADGLHLPEYMLNRGLLNRHGFTVVTAACHSRAALGRAKRIGVDLALVSPIFATASHVGAKGLGIHRFARLIDKAPLPVAALGGINHQSSGALRGLGLAAIAGISGLLDRLPSD